MYDTNHECKSRTIKIVTNVLSTTFVVDTKYEKCWQQYVADSNINAPSSLSRCDSNTHCWRSDSSDGSKWEGCSVYSRKLLPFFFKSKTLLFFFPRVFAIQYMDCHFIPGVKCCSHISSPVMIRSFKGGSFCFVVKGQKVLGNTNAFFFMGFNNSSIFNNAIHWEVYTAQYFVGNHLAFVLNLT